MIDFVTIEDIYTVFKKYNLEIDSEKADKLQKFLLFLIEVNKSMNLIRFSSKQSLLEDHVIDSAILANHIKDDTLDIGSGNGFPGIVLSILLPYNFYLVESIAKKASFLEDVVRLLELKNVKVVNKRVEDIEDIKVKFVTARAVALLPILIEYSFPRMLVGGMLLSLKGPKYLEELKVVDLMKCGAQLEAVDELDIFEKKKYIVKILKVEERIKKTRKNVRRIWKSILEGDN